MAGSAAIVQNPQQRVRGVQAPEPMSFPREVLKQLSWDDLRLFHSVCKTGSFRASAVAQRVAINTIRARVDRLERQLGETLFVRGRRGVSMTPAGAALRKIANHMRGAAVTDGLNDSTYLRHPQRLIIGTTEGLGSGWLTPRLLTLHQQFPDKTISLICDNDLRTDRSDEVDLGIAWRQPQNPDLIVSKLATLHYMAFASRDYLKEFGVPKTPDDLLKHRLIQQEAPGVKADLLDQLVGTERPPGFLPMTTNSSLAIFWAVANGVGIAFMPTYAAALVPKLVAIDLPFQIKFDVFYYYHPEARGCEVMTAARAWLKDCFNPVAHPWFSSHFVHPNDFLHPSSDNVVPLFRSLI